MSLNRSDFYLIRVIVEGTHFLMGKKRVRCLFHEALGSYSNLIAEITHLFPTRINVKGTLVGRVSCIATAKSPPYQGHR